MKSIAHGQPKLVVCPCCGSDRPTLKAVICQTCDWRDDGSDNDQACHYSKANGTNLNLARYRFLKSERNKTPQRRQFRVADCGGFLEEVSRTGRVSYRGPIPFVDYAEHGDAVATMPLRRRDIK